MTASIDELKKLVALAGERLNTLREHLEQPGDIAWESCARIYTNDVITPLKIARDILEDDAGAQALEILRHAPDDAAVVIPE